MLVHSESVAFTASPGNPHPFFVPFDHWLSTSHTSGDIRQESSEAVYRDMWGAFVDWCISQAPVITPESITAAQVEQFLVDRAQLNAENLGLTPRHAFRLVRLIDRVLQHHALITNRSPNPAAAECLVNMPEVRLSNAESADPLLGYFSDPEVDRLIEFLNPVSEPSVKQASGDAWSAVRNSASVALQLGAGLSPADIRALTLQSPVAPTSLAVTRIGVEESGKHLPPQGARPWRVSVPKCGASSARVAPVAPWAAELLQRWLQVRADNHVQGIYLFPSTKSGKPWGKVSQYNAANKVLEEAGLESSGGGSFRLRHTFAIRQLRRGTETAKVAEWLGVELITMTKYLRAMESGELVI